MGSLIKLVFGPIGTVLAVLAVAAVIYAPEILGRIEGKTWPVVTDMKFTTTAVNGFSAEVSGSFNVERPECTFHHIEWHLVTPTRTVLADVKFIEGIKARSEGYADFGPWHVSMSAGELQKSSLAAVFHQCPGRPWLTETHFYP